MIQQKKDSKIHVSTATGSLGIIAGTVGIGCAACGSILLTTIFGTSAVAGVLATLPLHGGEFAIIGVLLLIVTMYILAKQISKPLICK